MQLRFNNGNGAVTCDHCRIIFIEGPFQPYEWKALCALELTEGEWYCKKCSIVDFKEQERKFVEKVRELNTAIM